jgi:hypothetical protein
MASGEMTAEEFTRFLTEALELASSHAALGTLVYSCMDWRHMGEMLAAGCDLLNLCVCHVPALPLRRTSPSFSRSAPRASS